MAKRASTARKSTAGGSTAVKATDRIVVLFGKGQWAQREHLDRLRQVLSAAHGELETFVFDGRSAGVAEVFDELRSYSLMQTYKLVIVDEADQYAKLHREVLERYAAAPVDHATLVLRASTWNRGNLDKAIEATGALIKCEPPEAAEAEAWLLDRSQAEHGRALEPGAARALIERMGTEQFKLDSELGRLALMVTPGKPITAALVSQVVGRSSEEEAWAVQEAVLEAMAGRRPGIALQAVRELIDLADQPDVLVMYFVVDLMRKFAVAASMRQAGAGDAQVAKHLKLWGPRAQLFARVARQMPPERARTLLADVVRYDAQSKSGLGNASRNLECFLAGLGASPVGR